MRTHRTGYRTKRAGLLTITVQQINGDQATISTPEPIVPIDRPARATDEDPTNIFSASNGEPVYFVLANAIDGLVWTVSYEALTIQ